ncbi:MAG: hypothetical protein ABI718_08175 [Acidobacteriota bacterium]
MATIMLMNWPEVTKELYHQVLKEVNWENDVPLGAKFLVAWFGDEGLRVLDLWDSQQAFETFVQNRLMPVTQRLGIAGQPNVTFAESERIFAPNP